MAYSFNGIGTKFYGRAKAGLWDYVTTEWIVFLWVPILPLRSVLVVAPGAIEEVGAQSEKRGGSGSFRWSGQTLRTRPAPLNLRQIAIGYAWTAGVALGVWVLFHF